MFQLLDLCIGDLSMPGYTSNMVEGLMRPIQSSIIYWCCGDDVELLLTYPYRVNGIVFQFISATM